MANYRFKPAETEAMKKNILTHIEHEAETKTAWRLRCAIEGRLMCCRPSKREASRLKRELALYERLTKNDLPNWQSEPAQAAETPLISTRAAEAGNVSAEAENAENEQREAGNKPERKITYFHYTPEQLVEEKGYNFLAVSRNGSKIVRNSAGGTNPHLNRQTRPDSLKTGKSGIYQTTFNL